VDSKRLELLVEEIVAIVGAERLEFLIDLSKRTRLLVIE